MERAKPVNWSEVESYFARIIQTAFQSPLAHPVKTRLPSTSKNWTVTLLLRSCWRWLDASLSVISTLAVKIAFRGIEVWLNSDQVILTAWLALPNTVFGPLTGIATWWDPIASVNAALIEGLDTPEMKKYPDQLYSRPRFR